MQPSTITREERLLCDEARQGNLPVVRLLHEQGVSANIKDPWNHTPLMLAAYQESFEVAQYLVKNAGAFVDVKNSHGYTAMHIAAEKGCEPIVGLLIDHGASLNVMNENGHTPLMVARLHEKFDIVKLISSKLVNAIEQHDYKKARALLEQGIDVNVTNELQQTALHLSVLQQNLPLVDLLLHHNADVNLLDHNEQTAYNLALEMRNPNLAQRINTASVSITRTRDLLVYMRNAIQSDSVSDVKRLIEQGFDCNYQIENGDTILHLAVRQDRIRCLNYMLGVFGINLNALNNNSFTPLALSIKLGRRRLVPLIYAKVAPNTQFVPRNKIRVMNQGAVGFGTFGNVFEGEFEGTKVAVKVPHVGSGDSLLYEMKMIQMCQSPYIVHAIAVAEDGDQPLMALEYMDCDLRQYLDNKRQGIATEINFASLDIAWAIANALADLHRMGIINRDVKSGNVVLSKKHQVKLCDLGTARTWNTNMTEGLIGTALWAAPEVLNSQNYSYSSDIYSFGVILTELDTLEMPYYHCLSQNQHNIFDVMFKIRENRARPILSPNCEPWIRNLANRCLSFDPSLRPTAQEIVDVLHNELMRHLLE